MTRKNPFEIKGYQPYGARDEDLYAWDEVHGVQHQSDTLPSLRNVPIEVLEWIRDRFDPLRLTFTPGKAERGYYGHAFTVDRDGQHYALAKLTQDATEATSAVVLKGLQQAGRPATRVALHHRSLGTP